MIGSSIIIISIAAELGWRIRDRWQESSHI